MQFKDLTQTSRKFTIPLLEYFDSVRTTVRVGEARRLREGAMISGDGADGLGLRKNSPIS